MKNSLSQASRACNWLVLGSESRFKVYSKETGNDGKIILTHKNTFFTEGAAVYYKDRMSNS